MANNLNIIFYSLKIRLTYQRTISNNFLLKNNEILLFKQVKVINLEYSIIILTFVLKEN